jgi:hypothetical protein
MKFPIDANDYFKRVRRDPALHARAARLYAERAASVFERPPKMAISRSDAGRCGLQVKAEIAGGYDLPDDGFEARDQGTLRGLYKACCLKVAIEAEEPTLYVVLEHEAAWGGIGGHSDLGVYEAAGVGGDAECLWVLEIKHPEQYDVIPPHLPRLSKGKKTMGDELQPPRWDFVVQGGHSALADDAPIFSVAIWGLGSSYAQGDYELFEDLVYLLGAGEEATSLVSVAEEYARIALGEMDPSRPDFMCKSCRVSTCFHNENPLKGTDAVDLTAVLTQSVEAFVS